MKKLNTPTNKKRFVSQSGKSLVELLLVLVISAILVTMALTRNDRAQSNLQRQNFAREFKNNLERARFDSVKRRPSTNSQMSQITISGETNYNVLTDTNQNGSLESSEVKNITLSNRNGLKILGTNLVFPVTIRFNWRGQSIVRNGNGEEIEGKFLFCEGVCSLNTANNTNSNLISVSTSGTIAMSGGSDSPANYSAPNVSVVNSNTNINPWMTVASNSASTPLPTPTPIPSATPQPTSTPVAPLIFCESGERPLQTLCICKLPMTVRVNGKCM